MTSASTSHSTKKHHFRAGLRRSVADSISIDKYPSLSRNQNSVIISCAMTGPKKSKRAKRSKPNPSIRKLMYRAPDKTLCRVKASTSRSGFNKNFSDQPLYLVLEDSTVAEVFRDLHSKRLVNEIVLRFFIIPHFPESNTHSFIVNTK